MSDFTFLCPSCQQQIQASSEHSGMEVDCPLCQAKIVIPADPAAPPEKPKGRLSVSALKEEHKQPQSFTPQQPQMRPKKKSKVTPALITKIVAGVVVVIAGIIWGPALYHLIKGKVDEKKAEDLAETQPPPPPPEPSASEIMKQLGDKYKNMTSYSATGKTAASLDMSELAPGNAAAKSVTLTADTAIRFAKPDLYRLDWNLKAGQANLAGAVYSAGKGNYFVSGPYPAKVKNRETALSEAGGASGTIGMTLAKLFFSDLDSPANAADRFAKTNGAAVNNHDCYILAGSDQTDTLELWIDKKTLQVAQAEVYLNGGLDQDAYKAETNSTIKAQMLRASKIHGTITETYDNIAVDRPLAAADFEKSGLDAGNAAMMMTQPAAPAPDAMRRKRGGQTQ